MTDAEVLIVGAGITGAALALALADAGVPVRVAQLASIWTVAYVEPSRYHWMLQFYLRAHGLALSWVGTGRLIFSLNYGEAEFEAHRAAFVGSAAGPWRRSGGRCRGSPGRRR